MWPSDNFFLKSIIAISLFSMVQTGHAQVVKIGKQIWMAGNLNTNTFSDGSTIPEARSDEDWRKAGTERKPAWCYLNNDSTNGPTFGCLYNWYAVSNPAKVCPAGWHVPNDGEYKQLELFLGLDSAELDSRNDSRGAVNKIGAQLKATTDFWGSEISDMQGKSGFHAYPGGMRNPFGEFSGKPLAFFWTSSSPKPVKVDGGKRWSQNHICRVIFGDGIMREEVLASQGFSVRCIQDSQQKLNTTKQSRRK
jgi:uncharacterized protein (TIGR02145 family)